MAIGRVVIVHPTTFCNVRQRPAMKELNCQRFAEGNSAKVTLAGEGRSAELLLRYASFATAGLPKQEIDNVIALLAGQRSGRIGQ